MESTTSHYDSEKTQYPNGSFKRVKSTIPKRAGADGGYGWVVVVASLMTNLLTCGISSSFGVLFVDFLEYFGSSKATTSVIGSLFFSVPLILGPISSYCVNKWGCRAICITGSLIAGASLSAAFFAQSLIHLFVCFSLAGVGQSFCFLTSVIIIPIHFHDKLALASGISMCGEGIGSFIFPPLVGHLLEVFGWRGTLLILGGLLLNIVVFGSLMRNPDVTTIESESSTTITESLTNSCDSSIKSSHTYKSRSVETNGEIAIAGVPQENNYVTKGAEPVYKQSVCQHHGAKLRKQVRCCRGHLPCIATVLSFKCGRGITSGEQSSFERREVQPKEKLHRNAAYGVFCLSNAFLYACADIPTIYLPDYANGLGIEIERASFLLSIAGALNTIGVVFFGYLGDQPKVNAAVLYGCSVCICGVSVGCLPITSIYAVIALSMAFYGASISVISALDIIVLLGLVPDENFTTAYGLLLLVQGIATLLGSPLAGLIYDLTQSYELPFYGAGVFLVICGLMVIFLMRLWSKHP